MLRLLGVVHEPPYTEPYVRWCERTAGVNRGCGLSIFNVWNGVIVVERFEQLSKGEAELGNLAVHACLFGVIFQEGAAYPEVEPPPELGPPPENPAVVRFG